MGVFLWFTAAVPICYFESLVYGHISLTDMAGKEDPRSVLEQLRPKLILAFQFNLRDLAYLMHSEGFLSNSDHETVTAAVGSTDNNSVVKAGIMVDSLISKVIMNSENYQKFLLLVQPQRRKFSEVVDLLASGKSI